MALLNPSVQGPIRDIRKRQNMICPQHQLCFLLPKFEKVREKAHLPAVGLGICEAERIHAHRVTDLDNVIPQCAAIRDRVPLTQ